VRTIYISVICVLVASLLLFIFSFAYLDRTGHKTYYYVINAGGRDTGMAKIDHFRTEEKTLYKASCETPLLASPAQSRSEITYDNRSGLESFESEETSSRVTDSCSIRIKNDLASYVSRRGAKFQTLSGIPVKKDTVIFKQNSVLTYLPLIEGYDFRRTAPQGVYALIIFSKILPPIQKIVSISYLKDDYVKIPGDPQSQRKGARKIRTYSLVLKIRDFPQSLIWVARSDKSIVRIEVPQLSLKISRAFYPKTFEARPFIPKEEGYASRAAVFKSKNVQLEGTLTVPGGKARMPAVLLVGGAGQDNRDCSGLFSSIADFLSKNGYCALRFDRRGTGKSGGAGADAALSDNMEDLNAAVEYLAGQKEVDAGRIGVIGRQEGAYCAMKAAAENSAIKSLVLMAPLIYGQAEAYPQEEIIKDTAQRLKLGDDYARLAIRSMDESMKIVSESKETAVILGKKIRLKDFRERMNERPLEVAGSIKIPVLLLQGMEGNDASIKLAPIIDKALAANGNAKHELKYYGYLGPYFGKSVSSGVYITYYETDREVLANIKDWLDATLPVPVTTLS
jgi:uncharacterized protein